MRRSLRPSVLAWSGAAALALGVAFAGAACTVLTNDAPLDDAGVFEAGPEAGSTACTSCATQACLGPRAVCLLSEGCRTLRGCVNPFGESAAARDACLCNGHGVDAGAVDALSAFLAFASCSDARTCSTCATECASTCPGGAATGTPECALDAGADADAGTDAATTTDAGDAGVLDTPSVDHCAACVSDKCSGPKMACAVGSECAALLGCIEGCTDATCAASCEDARSSGKVSALELSNCTLTSCRSACGL